MKRAILYTVAGALLLALILIRVFSDKQQSVTNVQASSSAAIPVEAYLARDTAVRYQFVTIGTIRANESVDIVSEISRKITVIYMKEGTLVRGGELLFKLDDADIVARINKLTVEQKLATVNEIRERALLSKGGISQEKYDLAANQLNTLKADIDVLKVDLGKTEIRAPFAGRIGLRNVSEGTLVSPGLVLTSLQDLSRVKIDFAIPEKYANDLRPGVVVTFTTDYSPEIFTSVVEAVEPEVDLQTRTIMLRAVSDNRSGKLVAGASVKVYLDIMALDKSLFIPTTSLIPSVKGYSVFLIRSGKASLQHVKAGMRNDASVQIISGLAAGDTVITTNLLRVKTDVPVKMIKLQ